MLNGRPASARIQPTRVPSGNGRLENGGQRILIETRVELHVSDGSERIEGIDCAGLDVTALDVECKAGCLPRASIVTYNRSKSAADISVRSKCAHFASSN